MNEGDISGGKPCCQLFQITFVVIRVISEDLVPIQWVARIEYLRMEEQDLAEIIQDECLPIPLVGESSKDDTLYYRGSKFSR